MSKELKLERKGLRLWYKNGIGGRVAMAVQYEPSSPMASADYNPIYVGWDGEQGEPLDRILEELAGYRHQLGDRKVIDRLAYLDGKVTQLIASEDALSMRIETIWNKLFKKPIRLFRFKDRGLDA